MHRVNELCDPVGTSTWAFGSSHKVTLKDSCGRKWELAVVLRDGKLAEVIVSRTSVLPAADEKDVKSDEQPFMIVRVEQLFPNAAEDRVLINESTANRASFAESTHAAASGVVAPTAVAGLDAKSAVRVGDGGGLIAAAQKVVLRASIRFGRTRDVAIRFPNEWWNSSLLYYISGPSVPQVTTAKFSLSGYEWQLQFKRASNEAEVALALHTQLPATVAGIWISCTIAGFPIKTYFEAKAFASVLTIGRLSASNDLNGLKSVNLVATPVYVGESRSEVEIVSTDADRPGTTYLEFAVSGCVAGLTVGNVSSDRGPIDVAVELKGEKVPTRHWYVEVANVVFPLQSVLAMKELSNDYRKLSLKLNRNLIVDGCVRLKIGCTTTSPDWLITSRFNAAWKLATSNHTLNSKIKEQKHRFAADLKSEIQKLESQNESEAKQLSVELKTTTESRNALQRSNLDMQTEVTKLRAMLQTAQNEAERLSVEVKLHRHRQSIVTSSHWYVEHAGSLEPFQPEEGKLIEDSFRNRNQPGAGITLNREGQAYAIDVPSLSVRMGANATGCLIRKTEVITEGAVFMRINAFRALARSVTTIRSQIEKEMKQYQKQSVDAEWKYAPDEAGSELQQMRSTLKNVVAIVRDAVREKSISLDSNVSAARDAVIATQIEEVGKVLTQIENAIEHSDRNIGLLQSARDVGLGPPLPDNFKEVTVEELLKEVNACTDEIGRSTMVWHDHTKDDAFDKVRRMVRERTAVIPDLNTFTSAEEKVQTDAATLCHRLTEMMVLLTELQSRAALTLSHCTSKHEHGRFVIRTRLEANKRAFANCYQQANEHLELLKKARQIRADLPGLITAWRNAIKERNDHCCNIELHRVQERYASDDQDKVAGIQSQIEQEMSKFKQVGLKRRVAVKELLLALRTHLFPELEHSEFNLSSKILKEDGRQSEYILTPLSEIRLGANHNTFKAVLDGATFFLKEYAVAGDSFATELKALDALKGSPYVVTPTAAFHDNRHFYLEMKYYERTLSHWFEEHAKQPKPLAERFYVVHRLTAAIAYVHDSGIAHRDLKPSNIVLDENGSPVLSDFDLAMTVINGMTSRTLAAAGTPDYAPPETFSGLPATPALQQKADSWALGCMVRIIYDPSFKPSMRFANDQIGAQSAADWKGYSVSAVPGVNELVTQLMTADPEKRSSVRRALSSEFFLNPQREELPFNPECKNWAELKAYFEELKISAAYLDGRFNKCWCKECEKKRGKTDLCKQSGARSNLRQTGRAVGFARWAIRVHPNLSDSKSPRNVFGMWPECFHGTGDPSLEVTRKLLDSIISTSLLIPGDTTKDGVLLSVAAGHIPSSDGPWARSIFTTPSIRYASDPVYSKWVNFPFPNSRSLQIVLQIRQDPNSVFSFPHTFGKRGFNANEIGDPHGKTIEWRTDRRGCHCITGVLLRLVDNPLPVLPMPTPIASAVPPYPFLAAADSTAAADPTAAVTPPAAAADYGDVKISSPLLGTRTEGKVLHYAVDPSVDLKTAPLSRSALAPSSPVPLATAPISTVKKLSSAPRGEPLMGGIDDQSEPEAPT